ncbi:MAG TPA: hypothetical protein VNC22_15395 [Sporichthya sp.]|jgi:hypothetical protein|nr:hypothetical protein [Sporichthya sp.]
MPRSLQDILAGADALADEFEALDPDTVEWSDAAPLRRVREAQAARVSAEREVADAVVAARAAGFSWAVIGGFLGTSGEAARQRYAALGAPRRKTPKSAAS